MPSEAQAGEPAAAAWDSFDSEAYLSHYYEECHPDDEKLAQLTAQAFAAHCADRPGSMALDVVDVGTGPNLFPLLCALPFAKSLTAWEYSKSNVAWLEAEVARSDVRPLWRHYWDVARGAAKAGEAVLPDLAPLTRIRQASIYDLPARNWDAATMFFCAESITSDPDEFRKACAAYARSVRPGGLLVAAFLARSSGYEVAGEAFPAVPISQETLMEAFAPIAGDVVVGPVGGTEEQTHSGYSGALFLTARAV